MLHNQRANDHSINVTIYFPRKSDTSYSNSTGEKVTFFRKFLHNELWQEFSELPAELLVRLERSSAAAVTTRGSGCVCLNWGIQWIGWRENLPETMDFPIEYGALDNVHFAFNQSIEGYPMIQNYTMWVFIPNQLDW